MCIRDRCEAVPLTIRSMPKGVGDIMADLIGVDSSKCGGDCGGTLREMNKAGPQECRKRVDEFANKILANAKKTWTWQGIAANLSPKHAREGFGDIRGIDSMLDEAITRAEAALESV